MAPTVSGSFYCSVEVHPRFSFIIISRVLVTLLPANEVARPTQLATASVHRCVLAHSTQPPTPRTGKNLPVEPMGRDMANERSQRAYSFVSAKNQRSLAPKRRVNKSQPWF
ncbi:unnamed protein product [Ectocarpus sp. 12 AP-2014]